MNRADKSIIIASIIIAIIGTLISIAGLIMLLKGQCPAPALEGSFDNWCGNLAGSVSGIVGNSNLNAIIICIGFLALIFVFYKALTDINKLIFKVVACFACLLMAAIDIFGITLSASRAIIIIFLILCLVMIFILCFLQFLKTSKSKTRAIIEAIVSACFLTLLIWGALTDIIFVYKKIAPNIPKNIQTQQIENFIITKRIDITK